MDAPQETTVISETKQAETPPIPQAVIEEEKQQNNNETPLPKPTGFQLHPENINRNGAPKKTWTWKQLLEEAAEEMMEVKNKDGTVTARKALKHLVARKLLTAAAGGNVNAARELMNRMDGMPSQPIEHSGEVNLNVNDMLEKVYGGDPEPESTT